MKDEYGIKVTIRTPIFDERENEQRVNEFYLEEVIGFIIRVREKVKKKWGEELR
ncbi:hypothetical protein [Bacillus sp. FJAT-27245]|uniref:hypothetical protein n=1 Tax=Bacillus sp. FJAT-27245 TaxID=1684144 RepID=UPI000AC9EEB1|nr:hypothetical protein [Bacillus sp. FJAT-27245]